MKQFIYIFSTAFSLLLCVACTQADIVVPAAGGKDDVEEGVPLSVKNLGLSVEVESRSIVTGGPGGGAANPNPLTTVGLCVTNAKGAYYDNGNRTQQFAYNAQAAPAAAWEQAADEEKLLLYTEKGMVYGFFPAGNSVSITGTPKQPVMSRVGVLDKQMFIFNDGDIPVDAKADIQWETGQDDYLYGKAGTEVDRWHPEVSLSMNHALAKVSFRVLEAEGGSAFADRLVKKVVLKSSGGFKKSTSAKLNLATGELSGSMTAVDELWFTADTRANVDGDGNMRAVGSDETDPQNVAVQAFGLVIPVTGIDVTLELTLDDDRVFTMSPSGDEGLAGTFTAEWEKGSNYIYNIKISPQGIVITDMEVAGWNDGGSHNIPVE